MHLLGFKSLLSQGLSDLLHRLQNSFRCTDVYEFGVLRWIGRTGNVLWRVRSGVGCVCRGVAAGAVVGVEVPLLTSPCVCVPSPSPSPPLPFALAPAFLQLATGRVYGIRIQYHSKSTSSLGSVQKVLNRRL